MLNRVIYLSVSNKLYFLLKKKLHLFINQINQSDKLFSQYSVRKDLDDFFREKIMKNRLEI